MWGEEIMMSGADRSHTEVDRGIEARGGLVRDGRGVRVVRAVRWNRHRPRHDGAGWAATVPHCHTSEAGVDMRWGRGYDIWDTVGAAAGPSWAGRPGPGPKTNKLLYFLLPFKKKFT
jgi:hypothetical protein